MAKVDPAARLLRLIQYAEPRIARQVITVVNLLRDRFTLNELVTALERGPGIFLQEVQRASGLIASQIATISYIRSGSDTASWLTDNLNDLFDFDQTNTRAVQALQNNKLRLVQSFTQTQAETARAALVEGTRQGLNPRDQARLFRDSIGLTPRQLQAVSRYRQLLETGNSDALRRQLRDRRFDPTVLRAIEENTSLDKKYVNKLVDRYRERYIKYRSEVIARTEALRGVHEGANEMYMQAIDNGQLTADELSRTWNTAMDERVRGSHASMNGQRVAVNQPFISGNGYSLMYPGDINAPASDTVQCRCVASVRIG